HSHPPSCRSQSSGQQRFYDPYTPPVRKRRSHRPQDRGEGPTKDHNYLPLAELILCAQSLAIKPAEMRQEFLFQGREVRLKVRVCLVSRGGEKKKRIFPGLQTHAREPIE